MRFIAKSATRFYCKYVALVWLQTWFFLLAMWTLWLKTTTGEWRQLCKWWCSCTCPSLCPNSEHARQTPTSQRTDTTWHEVGQWGLCWSQISWIYCIWLDVQQQKEHLAFKAFKIGVQSHCSTAYDWSRNSSALQTSTWFRSTADIKHVSPQTVTSGKLGKSENDISHKHLANFKHLSPRLSSWFESLSNFACKHQWTQWTFFDQSRVIIDCFDHVSDVLSTVSALEGAHDFCIPITVLIHW